MTEPVEPVPIPGGPAVPLSQAPEEEFDVKQEAFYTWEKDELGPKSNALAAASYQNAVSAKESRLVVVETAAEVAAAKAAAEAAAVSAQNAPGTGATSTSSTALGVGTKNITLPVGKLLYPGQRVVQALTSDPANFQQIGTVVTNNPTTGALVLSVTSANDVKGTGTYAAWTISLAGPASNLPAATGADAGKVVGVVSGGAYALLAGRGAGGASPTAAVVLTASSNAVQTIKAATQSGSFTLPDATTMQPGGVVFMLSNAGGYEVPIRNSAGTLLAFIKPGTTASVGLSSNATAAGVWPISGASTIGMLANQELVFSVSPGANLYIKAAVQIDVTRDMVFIAGDTAAYAVVWDSSTGLFGAPVMFRNTVNVQVIATLHAANQVLVLSAAGTAIQGVILSVSGTAITVNTAGSTTNTGSFQHFQDLVAVPGQGYMFCIGIDTGSALRVYGLTVTGTTVAIGAALDVSGAHNPLCPASMFSAGSSRVLMFYCTSTTTGIVGLITQAGTTVTLTSSQTYTTAFANMFVRLLSTGRWALIYTVSNYVVGSIVSLSGTVITVASYVQLSAANTGMVPAFAHARGAQVVVGGTSSSYFFNVLTDNAGLAVAGTPILRALPGISAGNAVLVLLSYDADSVSVVAGTQSGSSGGGPRFHRVGFNGNNPAMLASAQVYTTTAVAGGLTDLNNLGDGSMYVSQMGRWTANPSGLIGAQGGYVTDPSGGYATVWRASGGAIEIAPKVYHQPLGSNSYGTKFCRLSDGIAWCGSQSSTTSIVLQKLQAA